MTAGLSGEILDGRHMLALRVYYEDTDATGAVYHASYLRFMERGRTDYLRLLGIDQRDLLAQTEREAPGFHFVVRAISAEFLKPGQFGDMLEVTTEPEEVRGASITVRQCVMRGAETLVEARVRVAFVSAGRARRIPAALRTAMGAHRDEGSKSALTRR